MDITANIAGEGLARIEVEGPRIKSVAGAGPIDPEKPWISTGFVDLQINGFEGVDFSHPELDVAQVLSALESIWKTGVTTFCPTLVTNTLECLERNFRILEQARRLDARFDAAAPCYHLEGPYLSPGGAHGAHDPHLMRNPDWDEFARLQQAAGGNIGIVTLAPELPGACDFIRHASEAGVIAAIGHTDCTPEQIHNAIEAGARLSTHLGNGCPAFIPRHENPIWAQIASDRLQASLICDGFHLPPDFVRTVYKAKGIGRCILVTDAIHAANLPPGRYSLAGSEIELLPSGQVVTADRRCMAGSALSMNRAIAIFQTYAGCSLGEALQAATANPAKLLGRDGIAILAGQPANLVFFRPEPGALRIELVLLLGEQVYPAG